MAVHHHLVAFDRPLVAVQPSFGAALRHTAAELLAARAAGHLQGGEDARAFSNQQIVELRTEMQSLQTGILQRLSVAHDELAAQVRAALPSLAVELGQRLLAGFVPPPDLVERLCREALDQLYPERDGLELVVGPRDAAALERLVPSWRAHFTNLRITIDDTLNPGDCLVRSRFGVTDARAPSKLAGLRQELLGV
ncbi:MAG: FliH/SctL family protein [Opitutaceae bacterium]|jgi:flagellar assembly protein FliH